MTKTTGSVNAPENSIYIKRWEIHSINRESICGRWNENGQFSVMRRRCRSRWQETKCLSFVVRKDFAKSLPEYSFPITWAKQSAILSDLQWLGKYVDAYLPPWLPIELPSNGISSTRTLCALHIAKRISFYSRFLWLRTKYYIFVAWHVKFSGNSHFPKSVFLDWREVKNRIETKKCIKTSNKLKRNYTREIEKISTRYEPKAVVCRHMHCIQNWIKNE